MNTDTPTVTGTSKQLITSETQALWNYPTNIPNCIDYNYDPTMWSLDARVLALSGGMLVSMGHSLAPELTSGMPIRNLDKLKGFVRTFLPPEIRMALGEGVNPLMSVIAGDGQVRTQTERWDMKTAAQLGSAMSNALGITYRVGLVQLPLLIALEDQALRKVAKRQS